MKRKVAKEVQRIFKSISVNSVGRSAPIGIYEKRIPKELRDSILKTRKNNGEEL